MTETKAEITTKSEAETKKTPFDFSNLFKEFDPTAMTKQIQDMFGSYKIPNVDMSALVQAQSKNVQALTAANRTAIEGTQKLLQRQAEMIQQALSEAAEAAKTIASSGGPKEAVAAQTQAIESTFEKAIANATEISDLVRQTQDESMKMVNARISESLQELRESLGSMK